MNNKRIKGLRCQDYVSLVSPSKCLLQVILFYLALSILNISQNDAVFTVSYVLMNSSSQVIWAYKLLEELPPPPFKCGIEMPLNLLSLCGDYALNLRPISL